MSLDYYPYILVTHGFRKYTLLVYIDLSTIMPKILSYLALVIYFPFTHYLCTKFLPCLVHCFKYCKFFKLAANEPN